MTPTPAVTRSLSWRLIRDVPRPGPANMALDHALARTLGEGEAVLRLYSWSRPTVSFGRNEPARDVYPAARSAELSEELGVDFVRRPTGGRAVLHDAELTYAVVAPIRALGGVREAYRRIHRALAAALRDLGAPVALADDTAVPAVDAGPCFQEPAGGEVTAAGRKLVGSAQCRIEGASLQHGSIILSGDQSLLARLSQKGREAAALPATLTQFVGGVGADDVARAVSDTMRETFPGSWKTDGAYREGELEAAERLKAERYGDDDWTWRR